MADGRTFRELRHARRLALDVLGRAGLACIVAVSSSTTLSNVEIASWSGSNGRIAFQRKQAGVVSIWTMTRRGTDLRRLHRTSVSETDPSWSPNGRRITFHRRVKNEQSDIFVIDADGSGLRRLTRRRLPDIDPSWSPAGDRIVYVRQRRSGAVDLYEMDVSGDDKRRITSGGGKEFQPAWSPAGGEIAFIKGAAGLYTVAPDGTGRSVVVEWAHSFDWAPDASEFVVEGSGPDGEGIYRVSMDGEAQLVTGGSLWLAPVWSPNGTRILAQRQRFGDRGGRPGIYRMSVDGSKKKRIRKTRALAFTNPDWQAR